MKSNNGINGYQPTIATQLVETTLQRIDSVYGEPLSLILPATEEQPDYELIAAGLKQFDGLPLDHLILIGANPNQSPPAVLQKGSFDSPVGKIEIDANLAGALAEVFPINTQASISDFYAAFGFLLPFIKRVAPFAKILPILLDPSDIDTAQNIARTLSNMLQEKKSALVVLSNIDGFTLTTVEFCDLEILRQSIPHIQSQTGLHLPISHANIIAAMQFAQDLGSNTVTLLKNKVDTSHTTPQQKVFHTSTMFYKYTPPNFVEAQQEELIDLAKAAITSYTTTGKIPKYNTEDPAYLRKTGIFVTLRQNGELRGCIGRLQPDIPLYRILQEMAVAAATADPRFPPIRTEEIEQLSFKIAVLSPMQRISINDVQVGKHGLLIAHRGRRGVLLPDVPVGRGWDRQTFLANLCIKAGLPPNILRENPTLYAFTAVEFGSD